MIELPHAPSDRGPPRPPAGLPPFMTALRERLSERRERRDPLADCRDLESELSYGRHAGPAPPSARPAAVLALLYPVGDDWRLPLTVRRRDLAAHGGQISLPGGLVDPDESSQQAALRELREELGVDPAGLTVLGRLGDLYVFVSDFVVTPWVAVAAARPRFAPNPAEVADLLELSLAALLDPATVGTTIRIGGGVAFRSPYFALGEHQIWGATGIILAELRSVVREACAM